MKVHQDVGKLQLRQGGHEDPALAKRYSLYALIMVGTKPLVMMVLNIA